METQPSKPPSNIPSRLVKLTKVLHSIEIAMKKNQIPLTMTMPANVYYECVQSFLSSLAEYSEFTFDNQAISQLINSSYTVEERYANSPSTAFLYFLALRIAKGDSEEFIYENLRYDYWMITVSPLKKTFEAAVDLIVRIDALRTLIIEDDEPLLLEHLKEFHRSWETFAEQLVMERKENNICFCPCISIRVYLEHLPEYYRLEERLKKIVEFVDEFPDDGRLVSRFIEQIPIQGEVDPGVMKCHTAAQKTLDITQNHLDSFGGFFRTIKICNTPSSDV